MCLFDGVCFLGVSCLNVGVGLVMCGFCFKGYEGDGRNCIDIDEVSRGDLLGEINFFCLV